MCSNLDYFHLILSFKKGCQYNALKRLHCANIHRWPGDNPACEKMFAPHFMFLNRFFSYKLALTDNTEKSYSRYKLVFPATQSSKKTISSSNEAFTFTYSSIRGTDEMITGGRMITGDERINLWLKVNAWKLFHWTRRLRNIMSVVQVKFACLKESQEIAYAGSPPSTIIISSIRYSFRVSMQCRLSLSYCIITAKFRIRAWVEKDLIVQEGGGNTHYQKRC